MKLSKRQAIILVKDAVQNSHKLRHIMEHYGYSGLCSDGDSYKSENKETANFFRAIADALESDE